MEKCDFTLINNNLYKPDFHPDIAKIINDFNAAYNIHRNLHEYKPSPLYRLNSLASRLGLREIYLKNEAERFGIGAIKMLGASYAVHSLLQQDCDIKSICTATDGNHGRSVAWSAANSGIRSYIFVPGYTVEERIRSITAEGGIVKKVKGNYDEAVRTAEDFSKKMESILVQDFAFGNYLETPARITAGYYTQLKEIEEQTGNFSIIPDCIILQCGNGSWPSAVVNFARNHPKLKNVQIACIEPKTTACMFESVQRGKIVTVNAGKTIMAGLNCGTPSTLAYEILRQGCNGFIIIPDAYAIEAIKILYKPSGDDSKIEAGESGAAGLAGLLALARAPELKALRESFKITGKSKILIFNTEGITDREFFNREIA